MTGAKSAEKVTFVFIGPLHTRGRLLKQISTLQQAGVTCDLILGNSDDKEPNPADYEFPITSIHVNLDSGKLNSFVNQMRFCRRAAKLISKSDADTIVCLALESLMAGVWAKKKNGDLRLIFDSNELHIECMGNSAKALIWKPIHNHGIQCCDTIIHAENNRMNHFKSHYPAKHVPQLVIENFPDKIEQSDRNEVPDNETRLVYLGGFGEGRFTREIISAFSELPANYQLDIIGSGRPDFVASMRQHLENLNATNVRILPQIAYKDIPSTLRNYHIGLAFYRNINLNNYYCAPNKIYDYLMNGIPVITNDYPGLISVIESNQVGACIKTIDSNHILEAIEEIRKGSMWDNITKELHDRYCWQSQTKKYLEAFAIHQTSPKPN